MGLDQQGRHALLGAVAMGKARVAFGAVSERLDGVALPAEALHALLLHAQLGLAQGGCADAAYFQAVGIVFIAAVPVVRIHDQGRPQGGQQAGHGARFRLGERAPVTVQVGMRGVQTRALLRAVGVDHGHNIQSDTPQVSAQGGVLPGRSGVDQA